MGDAIMVKRAKNDVRKVHLSSIRPPRLAENKDEPKARPAGFRPLYDIPFMFDAREFLRKKLIGQSVNVNVDYIQPANNNFPEKLCCTVTIGGVNVAEALVAKGLATVVRYSADNDQRSSHYDDLLAAEDKAIKSSKGMHDKKGAPARRIADVSGDVAKSKQFLPFLQRAGRMQGVVDFVASGSRFRLYIPRESCVITFLLAGISCPRASRTAPGGQGPTAGEPFGDDALAYVRELALQHEVEMEVEGMDKGGNFIGWMFVGNTNVSVSLVEEGYAAAYLMGESKYGRQIQIAEDNAKRRKERRWANYVEVEATPENDEEEKKKDDEERKVNYEKVVVTEVTSEGKVFAQHVDEGPKLEQLMTDIRTELTNSPPLAGAYQPKKGKTCSTCDR
jgi:staphylococcal nuclease domain-containing protein 1